MTAARTTLPSARTMLGLLGIAGGLGLLAAFVVDIPPALNTWRLVLFCAGAIAIAVAAFGRQSAVSPRWAIAGTVPVIVANAGYGAWILLAAGREQPFAGDFGLAGFCLALAMWLADAWFGLVALRIGAVPRWVALLLATGSLLAILGIDRVELTSPAQPTVFGPISLAGIALNAAAWVILGVAILRPGRRTMAVAVMALLVVGGLSACAPAAGPSMPPPSVRPLPEGWSVVPGVDDLGVALPPWLAPFDTTGAVFASEVVPGGQGGQGLQLLAEGGRTAEPQPGTEPLEQWLAARIESPIAGRPTFETVQLDAGPAVVMRRLDGAGTTRAWRIAAWAIRTPAGTAALVVDGPAAAWAGREEDVERIATRLRAGPAR